MCLLTQSDGQFMSEALKRQPNLGNRQDLAQHGLPLISPLMPNMIALWRN